MSSHLPAASWRAGLTPWFVYGWLLGSAPLMLANGFTGAQVLIMAGVKLRTARLRK